MNERSNDLNDRLRAAGFQHSFNCFGHGWGHCVICHSDVEVQYPEEKDKKCPGPRQKRPVTSGLEYDCCSILTADDWKKIDAVLDAMREKRIKEFDDRIARGNEGDN
ncbi:MAG: hypothetical protein A2676_03555 [Candidatus Sungbacteria bacterium RIFCSPHIGHO2_01_FULL_51_22]|nr:MAG: hypothetical protein A2676_03555 [Candidatus Sungbacteria bacterium RIFCSPHIGHO2_01_FULL_51_22]